MKVIKIGFDLDGVIAQHSLGGLWFKLRMLKEKLLKKTHSSSYYFPNTFVEKIVWMLIDWFRRPYAERGLLSSLARTKQLQFYLITGRFQFLEKLTLKWLRKNKFSDYFEKVLINTQDLEPTAFKAKKINQLGLDFFVDDDPGVVASLKQKTAAKIINACDLNQFLRDILKEFPAK